MKTFTHTHKLHWREIRTGLPLTGSKYNTEGIGTQLADCIEACTSYGTCYRDTCWSEGYGVVIDEIFNCIFNADGKSFWEEIEDAK